MFRLLCSIQCDSKIPFFDIFHNLISKKMDEIPFSSHPSKNNFVFERMSYKLGILLLHCIPPLCI